MVSVARPIVASSPLMAGVLAHARRAGKTDETVLLLGESGTGKELLARSIHDASARKDESFVPVNCGALPEGMVEAILFGHERGAYTSAVARRDGKFVEAHGGTLFLDEIGELAPAIQVKLLRALQEREIEPLGGGRRAVDVRVVAATNRDLAAMMKRGQFREDLYYRLDVLTIRVPPLRERREDVPALVRHFLGAGAAIDGDALAQLGRFGWPGNVRQLENFVKKLVLAAEGGSITAAETARLLAEADPGGAAAGPPPPAATHPGGRTRPAATTETRPSDAQGLAIAWWRFRAVQGDEGQPYACTVAALASAAKVESVRFAGDRARVGRDRAQVELALDTGEVSRVHASIRAHESGFSIEDEDSRNHTYVDARELGRGDRAALVSGTVVRIGKEWLGIAIEIGAAGVPDAPLPPMLLARGFAAAAGDPGRRIDIRAVEALCAGRLDEDAIEQMAQKLAREPDTGVVDRSQIQTALPAAPSGPDPRAMSREQLLAFVAGCGGNKREAARRLGISHTTLWKRLRDQG
jgi:DNA-binding NtrC family response regulator